MVKKLPHRERRPEAVLSNELRKIFEIGRDFFGYFHARLSDEELREKLRNPWRLHQKTFMKEWLADFDHLGKRPYAWWQFSWPNPELRRCIAGWLPIEGAPIWMGYRCHWVDKRTVIEPEVFYLERHAVLTPAELRLVTVLKEKAVAELKEKSRNRGCPDPSTWNWDGIKEDWNGKGDPMRLRELPTRLLWELAARCDGLNAAGGDGRIVLRAVSTACAAEIERRIEGGDFPEISKEAIAVAGVQISLSLPDAFARLLYELEA